MKIQFNGYEIEIKAKHDYDEKTSKHCVLEILNDLSVLYYDSAELHEKLEDGDGVYKKYAELQLERSKMLHDICAKNRLYD